MTGALVGKVCDFPLCDISAKHITRHSPPRHSIDAALWSLCVKWHSRRRPGAPPRFQRLSHPSHLHHASAGGFHFQRPHQLHPPRHDFRPHRIQVHLSRRDDVCSCNATRTHSSCVAASLFSPTWTRFTAAAPGALVNFFSFLFPPLLLHLVLTSLCSTIDHDGVQCMPTRGKFTFFQAHIPVLRALASPAR